MDMKSINEFLFVKGTGSTGPQGFSNKYSMWKDINDENALSDFSVRNISSLPNFYHKNDTDINQKTKEPVDIKIIMDFVYERLVFDDFGYGDSPDLKYIVEKIFNKNKEKAEMAFINMASKKVFLSDYNIIEKFFALLMSLEEDVLIDIAMPIILIFSSNKDQSAAEGALTLLEKYGRDKTALDISRSIRDFDYDFLNEYKSKVINNLLRFDNE